MYARRIAIASIGCLVGLSSCTETVEECPPVASSCPSMCDDLTAFSAEDSCHEVSRELVVGCIEDAAELLTGDIGCAVRLADNAVFFTVSGTIENELVTGGGWRSCSWEEQEAASTCQ